ncbi:MAG: hypothetical protein ACPGU1_01200 [Myxococcota bacterium]
MRRHRPDYVVVSLGTNDHQALKTRKGWIKTSNERWASSYKQRVLIMLRRLSGRDRRRAIVWLGPTNFDSNNARKLGPKINRLIREAIEEFDGPAVFVDARRATSNKNGEPGVTYRHPKKGNRPMRTDDGIHLTTEAVRTLLAAPVHRAFAPCWDSDIAARDAIRQQRKDERMAKRKAKQEAAKAKREEARAKKEAARVEKAAKKADTKEAQASDVTAKGPSTVSSKPKTKPESSAPHTEAKSTENTPAQKAAPSARTEVSVDEAGATEGAPAAEGAQASTKAVEKAKATPTPPTAKESAKAAAKAPSEHDKERGKSSTKADGSSTTEPTPDRSPKARKRSCGTKNMAEDKKAEDKKAEDKKAEDKKAEDKKAEDKKATAAPAKTSDIPAKKGD